VLMGPTYKLAIGDGHKDNFNRYEIFPTDTVEITSPSGGAVGQIKPTQIISSSPSESYFGFVVQGNLSVKRLSSDKIFWDFETQSPTARIMVQNNNFLANLANSQTLTLITNDGTITASGNTFGFNAMPLVGGGNSQQIDTIAKGGTVEITNNNFTFPALDPNTTWHLYGMEVGNGLTYPPHNYVVKNNVFLTQPGGNGGKTTFQQVGVMLHTNTTINNVDLENNFTKFLGLPVLHLKN